MKKQCRVHFLILSCIFIYSLPLSAQRKLEIGAFGSASYYLGDINPSRQFYNPSPAFGAALRYIYSDRQVFRVQVNYGQFKGADRDFNNAFQQNRNISFSASLLDIDAIYEFNFLPFRYKERHHAFSPFLFAGLGYEVILHSQYNIPNHIAVPFGMGLKYLVTKRTTVGMEWSFRKTFQNQIDGIVNPGGNQYKSIFNNNDWYSFAGFFISFRLFDSVNCAVYQ